MQLLEHLISVAWSSLVILALLALLVGLVRWGLGPRDHFRDREHW